MWRKWRRITSSTLNTKKKIHTLQSHLYRNKIYFKYNSIKCRFKTHLYRNQHSQSWLCIIWHHSIRVCDMFDSLGSCSFPLSIAIYLCLFRVHFRVRLPRCTTKQAWHIILIWLSFFSLDPCAHTLKVFFIGYWLPTWSTILVSVLLSMCLCTSAWVSFFRPLWTRFLHVRIFIAWFKSLCDYFSLSFSCSSFSTNKTVCVCNSLSAQTLFFKCLVCGWFLLIWLLLVCESYGTEDENEREREID